MKEYKNSGNKWLKRRNHKKLTIAYKAPISNCDGYSYFQAYSYLLIWLRKTNLPKKIKTASEKPHMNRKNFALSEIILHLHFSLSLKNAVHIDFHVHIELITQKIIDPLILSSSRKIFVQKHFLIPIYFDVIS